MFRRDVPAGFYQNFVILIAKPLDQIKRFALCERLAARYFHQLATELAHFFDNRIDGEMVAAREGVFAVAPGAAHGTTRQANERAGTSGMR